MVKEVIGERKEAVEANPNLLKTERWDQSDIFYAVRTRYHQQGYDVSRFDKDSERRKKLHAMIQPICENFYKVKRHKIGIFPKDRAIMAFQGRTLAVNFDNLRTLMLYGTDVIVVEKQGTVIKLAPFTAGLGLAFIQAEGFVSEYGEALAGLVIGTDSEARHYTNNHIPIHKAHLGVLTDCDASGLTIGIQIRNATRLGIGLNTIEEINFLNPRLEIKDLVESCSVNTHWQGLCNLLENGGNRKLTWQPEERDFYDPYLRDAYKGVRFID